MLISPQYVNDNLAMHERLANYGAYGSRWADRVRAIAARTGSCDVLDYGCGKGTLAKALTDLTVREYDPAIPGKDALPASADLVVCTDVLEHIEPDCIDEVIAHIGRLTRTAAFLNISTRLAAKSLDDGRNAHLIVQDAAWWRALIEGIFDLDEWQVEQDQVNCVARPKAPAPPGA